MRISVSTLVLEVTRRCNMCCEHCLRGDAQNIDMQKETVDKVLSAVDSIAGVTFTGGEPSLNIPIIEYFFERAEQLGKLPESFYVVTNGAENQFKLAATLLKWYAKMDERDVCGVSVSRDSFHDELDGPNVMEGLSFYSTEKAHAYGDTRWVMREGRAAENDIGQRPPSNMDPTIELYGMYDELHADIDMLYVAANENVAFDCDASYQRVDATKYGVIGDLRDTIAYIAANDGVFGAAMFVVPKGTELSERDLDNLADAIGPARDSLVPLHYANDEYEAVGYITQEREESAGGMDGDTIFAHEVREFLNWGYKQTVEIIDFAGTRTRIMWKNSENAKIPA